MLETVNDIKTQNFLSCVLRNVLSGLGLINWLEYDCFEFFLWEQKQHYEATTKPKNHRLYADKTLTTLTCVSHVCHGERASYCLVFLSEITFELTA